MSEILSPGQKFESMFTIKDPSYTVKVCFVDLQYIVWGNRHSYSESDTLLKYSKAKYSPISTDPSDHIRLATPSYYQNLDVEENSELIRDDLEGSYKEHLNWKKKGSHGMEAIKKNIKGPPLYAGNSSLSLKITWASKDFWMYCASIDPNTNHKRMEQMENLSSGYDFMTKIESPTEFAKQLGRDVGKYISNHKILKCNQPGFLYNMTLTANKFKEKHLISVDHGPIIYLSDDKIQEVLNKIPNVYVGSIIPFVKQEKYENQQEYRFVVSVQWHRQTENILDLPVSNDLRKLLSPIDNPPSRRMRR